MAIDKTNNLAAFLDDIADGIRVAETGSATPDNNDIPAQSFRSRIEALPATVRPDVERAGTTVKVTADDTNDTLTISASNNQGTGYVTGADKTASTTVTLTTSGPEVTATATDGTKVSKSVATVTRANTTLSSVANTTNNTLDFTASNNQGTGYVTGANKTATKSVSLSTNGATVTASDGTNSISTTIASGSYSASHTLTAGAGSVKASSDNVVLGTKTTTKPTSGHYITTQGSGTVSATGTATVGTAGYISAGSKTSTSSSKSSNTEVAYYPVQEGVHSAGISLSAGTGAVSTTSDNVSLTVASSKPTSGYYITSTGAGSVSGTATSSIDTEGYLETGSKTSSGTKSSNAATKYYTIPTGGCTVSGGGLSVSSNYSGTPTVDIALNEQTISGVAITDTKPTSGHYLTVGATSSALSGTTNVSRAAITDTHTEGYIPAKSTTTVISASSASPTVTVNAGSKTEYITIPSGSCTVSGGGLSGGSSVTPTVSVYSGMNTNMSNVTIGSKDTTNYPYYFKVNGLSSSGSSTVSRAAIKDTHTAGYIPAKSTTTVINSDSKTVTVNAGIGSSYVGLKGASLTAAGSVGASATVTPGDLSLVSQVIPVDGKKLVPVEIATSTSDITSPFYTVVRPEVAEGSATISGSGVATATVSSTGYAPADLFDQGPISVSGTATSSAKVGDSHYLSIPAGAVTVMTTPVSVVPTMTCSNGTITANVSQSISVTPYATTDGYVDNSRITTGYLTASGSNSIHDDNLISENIKAGVSIFGVTGDYVGTDSGGAKYSAMVLKKAFSNTIGSPIDYGFEYNRSLKAMVPQNKGKDSSFALCRVFLTVKETCDVTLEVMNYAEATYDYGIIGNLNQYLSRTATGESSSTVVKKAFSAPTDNKNSIQEVVFSNLSAGEYFFEVKYKKDTSTSSNNDTFYFKFKEVPFVVYADEFASACIDDIRATSDGALNIEISNDSTTFTLLYETSPGEKILPSKIVKGENILGVVGTARTGGYWKSFSYQIAGMSELTFSDNDYPTRAMKITIPDLTKDKGGTWRLGIEDDDGWTTLNDIRNGTIYVMDTTITAYIFRTTDTSNRPAVYEYVRQWENISIDPPYTLSSGWTQTIDVKYLCYD